MTDERSDPVVALGAQQAVLSALLAGLDDDGWHRPSRCHGWDVADVVLHLAQTNEMAIGSLADQFDEVLVELTAGLDPTDSIDDGAGLMVARDRADAPQIAHARYLASVEDLTTTISGVDLDARVTWVAGELAARTLVTTRLAETWIHTGDVAAGLDIELEPSDRLFHIARLAWRTLPHAFAREARVLAGPVTLELDTPSGATWLFGDEPPTTTVTGSALDLCLVASRRVDPAGTSLVATGPDAQHVLRLVRTWA